MIIAIVIIAVLLLYIWVAYNGLISSRMRVKEAWSQIDVQLKRRTDLIPNLVESVKGYVKHEKELLTEITKARSALMSAKHPGEMAAADNQLTAALKSLFAVAENYPQLRANENFMHLQQELSDTEDKISYARQYLNTSVLDYNTKLQTFPTNIIAQQFNFKEEEFFKATEEDRKKVEVKF